MSRLTCLLTAAALLFTLPLAADDKKDDKKKTEQKSEPKASDYVSVGEFDAIITKGPGKDGGSITIRGSKIALEFTKRGKANLKAVEEDPKIELTSDVKVRYLTLPPKKDEKGKTIPYTEKEKKELKGDPNQKGYKAELDDLTPGKVVVLHIVKLRGAKGDEAEKRFADRVFIKGDAPVLSAPEKGGERKKDK